MPVRRYKADLDELGAMAQALATYLEATLAWGEGVQLGEGRALWEPPELDEDLVLPSVVCLGKSETADRHGLQPCYLEGSEDAQDALRTESGDVLCLVGESRGMCTLEVWAATGEERSQIALAIKSALETVEDPSATRDYVELELPRYYGGGVVQARVEWQQSTVQDVEVETGRRHRIQEIVVGFQIPMVRPVAVERMGVFMPRFSVEVPED